MNTCDSCRHFEVMLRTVGGIGRGQCVLTLPPWMRNDMPSAYEPERAVYSGDSCSFWQPKEADRA